MRRLRDVKRYAVTGLLVLLPAGGTVFILHALLTTLDHFTSDVIGTRSLTSVPGLGVIVLIAVILIAGLVSTHVIGQHLVAATDLWMQRIPVVRTVYLTLKGMADVFNFRERFGRSRVVVFPFPREGLWALGFVMGAAPPPVALAVGAPLVMVFVPTAIHPFTGYLAFVPGACIVAVDLAAEEAMKVEFSAGLYRPRAGWLRAPGQSKPSHAF